MVDGSETYVGNDTEDAGFTKAVLEDLAENINKLRSNIPVNEHIGYPSALLDPTVVAEEVLCLPPGRMQERSNLPANKETALEILQEAAIPLDLSEGYPTVNGLPVWERLAGEILTYFKMFKFYRDLPLHGYRRAIYRVAETFETQPYKVNAIKDIYQWDVRIKAFDEFREVQQEVQRNHYIQDMESEHREAAQDLFATCMKYFHENLEMLDQKTALKWAEMAVELERLSLGLDPKKPDTENVPENIQQTLIQVNEAGPGSSVADHEERNRMQNIMDILNDAGVVDVPVDDDENDSEDSGDNDVSGSNRLDNIDGTGDSNE